MLQKGRNLIFMLIITASFISCQFDTVYNEIAIIDDKEWEKDHSAHFEVNISDTASLYNFYMIVHNTTDYRYSNLFVFLTTTFPNQNRTRDTIEFILADASGRWLGKGWGNVKETDILLKSDLRFPLSGNYDFLVQHAMRADTLQGIRGVGLRIEKLTD